MSSVDQLQKRARYTFARSEGETYLVEFSTDLVEWTPLGTEVVAGGIIQFTHVNAAVNDHAFYRAILQLEP